MRHLPGAGGPDAVPAILGPTAQPDDQQRAERAVVALLRTVRDVETVLTQRPGHYDLSLSRFAILMELRAARDGILSMSKLSQRLVVVPSNITKQVFWLESRGLVERQQDPNDGRVTLISITPAGLTLLDSMLPEHYAGQSQIMALLDQDEQTELIRLLDLVRRGARAAMADE